MARPQAEQWSTTVRSLKEAASQALHHQSADEFEHFERLLNQFDVSVRELKQSLWADEAKSTVKRLERGDELTPADRQVIESFLIADAEQYLAHENNFQDWCQELERLMDEINRRISTVDRDSINELRGVLKDAVRLVPDVRNYLDEQRRIQRFHAAMKTLDKPARVMLAKLLHEQLASPQR